MKKLILIAASIAALASTGHAQSISVWLDQLGALQNLEHTVQQGYHLVTGHLQTIGDDQAEEYDLHSTYFSSLDTVKPAINQDPRIIALRTLSVNLQQAIDHALAIWRKQKETQP